MKLIGGEETDVKHIKLLGETGRSYDETKVEQILKNQGKLEETERKLIGETERNLDETRPK